MKKTRHKNRERGLEGGGEDGTECLSHGEELQQVEDGREVGMWKRHKEKQKICMKEPSEPITLCANFLTLFTFIYLFIYLSLCLHSTCVHVSWHICGGPSTIWVLELDLGHTV